MRDDNCYLREYLRTNELNELNSKRITCSDLNSNERPISPKISLQPKPTQLVYEQDEVELGGDEITTGKLRIVEKDDEPYIEWSENFDDVTDSEWAVISPPKACYSINASTNSDSVMINNCKRQSQTVSVPIAHVDHCRITKQKKKLELFFRNRNIIGEFNFRSQHCGFFFDVLQRYVAIQESETDSSIFFLQNKLQSKIDEQLSALNLVPVQKSPKHHHRRHLYSSHWGVDAPRKVWGFINNMKRDPYTTTLTTFSKVYDVILNGDFTETSSSGDDTREVVELLHNISGMDDLEPGYEILTKRTQLVDRPIVERLNPLTHEEFQTFVSHDGSICQVDLLKERIFKGGLHPNVRPELWCYLLGNYEWHSTYPEREARKRKREEQYFLMKKQWKTISEDQEKNFSGFRDRKSIIEKDVNRTDRNHPFFEGENNPNLDVLHDILMTYIMYNFDLGYVQGMSDLLAPILYVTQHEPTAFWCFVGYMNTMYRNFDLDQSGMKQQLGDLSLILRVLDPEFVSFLESQDSANLYFCFRWLLVRFKRELNYSDTLRLWEVLWTQIPCTNFHLCFAAAIFDKERNEIIEKKYGFTEILKHVNGLAMCIDLEGTLKTAEAIYQQLSKSSSVPSTVRSICNLPEISNVTPKLSPCVEAHISGFPGRAERVIDSSVEEKEFEDAFERSFMC